MPVLVADLLCAAAANQYGAIAYELLCLGTTSIVSVLVSSEQNALVASGE